MTNGIRNGNLQAVNHALSDMKEKIKNARADKSQACVCLQMILRHAGSCWESVTSGGEDLFHKKRAVDGQGDRTEDLLMRLFYWPRIMCMKYLRDVPP